MAEAARARALARGEVVFHPGVAFRRVDEASPLLGGTSAVASRIQIGASEHELDAMHKVAQRDLDKSIASLDQLVEYERWDRGGQPFVATIKTNASSDKNDKRAKSATTEPVHGCVHHRTAAVACRDKMSDLLRPRGLRGRAGRCRLLRTGSFSL